MDKPPTLARVMKAVEADNHLGFCIACDTLAHHVEPDAREYRCGKCGENKVYGAEEILLQQLHK